MTTLVQPSEDLAIYAEHLVRRFGQVVAVNDVRRCGEGSQIGHYFDALLADLARNRPQFRRKDEGLVPLPLQFEGKVPDNDLGSSVSVQQIICYQYFQREFQSVSRVGRLLGEWLLGAAAGVLLAVA